MTTPGGVPTSPNITSCEARADYPRQDIAIPVALTGTDGTPATMWGALTIPAGATRILVLIHGASYRARYWDMQPSERYSFVQAAWEKGWATLALDRPGHGYSTPVDPAAPTPAIVADAFADLVADLRAGEYGETEFASVFLVGHSAGTAMSLYTVQNHPDLTGQLAGVALTGMVHAPSLDDVAVPADAAHQANLESRFSELPDGWITTKPGVRDGLWWSATSPHELPEQDEHWVKDYYSREELTGAREYWAQPVTVPFPPVLVTAGDADTSFCGGDAPLGRCHDDDSLLANERQYFPAGTDISVHLVRGAGHCLSWDRTNATQFLLEWAATRAASHEAAAGG